MALGSDPNMWEAIGALKQQAATAERTAAAISDRLSEVEAKVHSGATRQEVMANQVQGMSGKIDAMAATFESLRNDLRSAAEIGGELKRIKTRFAWAGVIGFGALLITLVFATGSIINKISAALPAAVIKETLK